MQLVPLHHGVYDQRTAKKVGQWQAANGLPKSGYFGRVGYHFSQRYVCRQTRFS
jgi:hypothetical protein